MTNKQRFERFHAENPQVYALFKRFAFEAIDAGNTRLSAGLIFERIRWETSVVTRGDQYKLNDIYEPYYSRLFMAEFPEHGEFFKTRRLRVA